MNDFGMNPGEIVPKREAAETWSGLKPYLVVLTFGMYNWELQDARVG